MNVHGVKYVAMYCTLFTQDQDQKKKKKSQPSHWTGLCSPFGQKTYELNDLTSTSYWLEPGQSTCPPVHLSTCPSQTHVQPLIHTVDLNLHVSELGSNPKYTLPTVRNGGRTEPVYEVVHTTLDRMMMSSITDVQVKAWVHGRTQTQLVALISISINQGRCSGLSVGDTLHQTRSDINTVLFMFQHRNNIYSFLQTDRWLGRKRGYFPLTERVTWTHSFRKREKYLGVVGFPLSDYVSFRECAVEKHTKAIRTQDSVTVVERLSLEFKQWVGRFP